MRWFWLVVVCVVVAVGCGSEPVEVGSGPVEPSAQVWVEGTPGWYNDIFPAAGLGDEVVLVNQPSPDDSPVVGFGVWRADGKWSSLPDLPVRSLGADIANVGGSLFAVAAVCDESCGTGAYEIWRLGDDRSGWERVFSGPEFEGVKGRQYFSVTSEEWAVIELDDHSRWIMDSAGGLRALPGQEMIDAERLGYQDRVESCLSGDVLFSVVVRDLYEVDPDANMSLPKATEWPLGFRYVDLSKKRLSVERRTYESAKSIPGMDVGSCVNGRLTFVGSGVETQVLLRQGKITVEQVEASLDGQVEGVRLQPNLAVAAPGSSAIFATNFGTYDVIRSDFPGKWVSTKREGLPVATSSAIVIATTAGLEK